MRVSKVGGLDDDDDDDDDDAVIDCESSQEYPGMRVGTAVTYEEKLVVEVDLVKAALMLVDDSHFLIVEMTAGGS
jgi:hypothetical protein